MAFSQGVVDYRLHVSSCRAVEYPDILVTRDRFLHLVIEFAHDLAYAIVDIRWKHDIGDNVDIAFVYPAEGAFNASVQVVDLQAVDS